jgi:hypothetical protein
MKARIRVKRTKTAVVLRMPPKPRRMKSVREVLGHIDIPKRTHARLVAGSKYHPDGKALPQKSDALRARFLEEGGAEGTIARATFVAYELVSAQETLVEAKTFIDHEIVAWIEETSPVHFAVHGPSAMVPLWCLAADWNLPAIDHDYVVKSIEEMGGASDAESYRAAVRDFEEKLHLGAELEDS